VSGNLASGLLLLLLGVWLFVRVWWGGLARRVAAAVTG
jgi:ABC-type nickel/cobalt efflux system permease component RcnA